MKIDLFEQVIDDIVLNRNFRTIRENEVAFNGAMRLVNEVYNSIKSIDDDFKIQFQSNGFDARIWELYLLATFQELGFDILRQHKFPDFELVLPQGKKIFVEAVTSNPAFNKEIEDKLQIVSKLSDNERPGYIENLRKTSLTKIAGALYNKYKKEYWKHEWVKDRPLVLAVEAFHHSFALDITDSSLIGYLYGFENQWFHDVNGNLVIQTIEQTEHSDGTRIIPSNFFSLPGAENISAVIFSNSGTISKFNRLAKLRNYSNESLLMVREGTCYNHDPNASIPFRFKYIVGKNGPIETWREGLSIYHNPNAINKLTKDDFPGILNGFFDKHFYAYVPEFHPYQSITNNHILVSDEE